MPASHLLTSALMLLSQADALSSREQTTPLLSVFYTFGVGGHQICEDPGIASFKPRLSSEFLNKFICEISHFVAFYPTSKLLWAEIAARQIPVHLYIFSITFQFFSNLCLLNQVSLYLPYSLHQGLTSSFVWFLSKRSSISFISSFVSFFPLHPTMENSPPEKTPYWDFRRF